MALCARDFSYNFAEIYVDSVLGVGSYGKVCKAKCGQLPCAAKLLHDTLFQDNDPGTNTLARRFEQECQFLSNIKHPNIIQYLGTMRDPKSHRTVILMELMDESLTRFLERSTLGLPYHCQLNICHDVALALAYLHSNTIIHRDISSNNILLIGEGSRAKVTDFGMSKLTEMNPRMTPLTHCPGTSAYMPPEALIVSPHYSSKLDIFSHGVLTIQIVTRNYPNPGDAVTCLDDPKYPSGRVFVQNPEADRRKKDIDLIEADHPLLPTVLHCIKDRDRERPSADELCEGLASLKSSARYRDSVEQNRAEQTSSTQRLLDSKEEEHHSELQRRTEDHRREMEQVIEEFNALKMEKEILCNELRDSQAREQQCREELEAMRQSSTAIPLMLTWRQGKPAPAKMESLYGSAVVCDNTAYFSSNYRVFSYSLPEDKWTQLQQCEYEDFSLAVVNNKLTTIGGCTRERTPTNSLSSLTGSGVWEKLLPPMPTSRAHPAAVITTTHLVVAGGEENKSPINFGGGERQSSVEVLDTDTLQWSRASSVPRDIVEYPQMTLCGGCLYISDDNTMFSCFVERLLQSCRQQMLTLSSSSSSSSSKGGSVWTRLADIPVHHGPTLATLGGHVLAIGGDVRDDQPTGIIHCYDRATNSWRVAGEIPTPRKDPLVAVLPNELIVVGGLICDITEIAHTIYITN